MAEISFARQFLSALDSRPVKLPSDHVVDPRSFPAQSPFILPKMQNAKRKRTAPSDSVETEPAGLTVTLKALKSDPLVLKSQTPTTSAFELKTAFASHFNVAVEKVRLLKDKKPVQDSKVLKEIVAEAATEVEFSIVLLPGAQLSAPKATPVVPTPPIATPVTNVSEPVNEAGEVESKEALRGHGKDELKSDLFWEDLSGFLIQRLRDEKEGLRIANLFKSAYEREI